MFFKKKNVKKILKKNNKLINILKSKFTNSNIKFRETLNYVEHLEKSINCFVKDGCANNLLFFGFRVNFALEEFIYKENSDFISLQSFTHKSCFYTVENFLKKVDFLEFAYVTKKKNGWYMLFCVKGLLGYNKSILSNFYNICHPYVTLHPVEIIHLKSEKKILKYFNFLIKNSDFENDYYFKGRFLEKKITEKVIVDNYGVSSLKNCFLEKELGGELFNIFFSSIEENNFIFGREVSEYEPSLKLNYIHRLAESHSSIHIYKYTKENREVKDAFVNQYNKVLEPFKGNILYFKNDIKVISRKVPNEQSIINLWVLYMRANNLYVKDYRIYKKIELEDAIYIGNLDYLKYNMHEIINFLKIHFTNQLSGFPINDILIKYLNSAYNNLLTDPYCFLPYLEEDEMQVLLLRYKDLYNDLICLEKIELNCKYDLKQEESSNLYVAEFGNPDYEKSFFPYEDEEENSDSLITEDYKES